MIYQWQATQRKWRLYLFSRWTRIFAQICVFSLYKCVESRAIHIKTIRCKRLVKKDTHQTRNYLVLITGSIQLSVYWQSIYYYLSLNWAKRANLQSSVTSTTYIQKSIKNYTIQLLWYICLWHSWYWICASASCISWTSYDRRAWESIR